MTHTFLHRGLAAACAALGLAVAAQAQAINLDYGGFNPAPSSTYAAGASQPGFWNLVASSSSTPLKDINNANTSVTVSSTGGNYGFGFNNAGTTGDDELLLDDGIDGATTINFAGLANGSYTVYTYAWAPDNRTGYITSVSVPGSPDPVQNISGTWTGTHQQGVTYAKHTINVTSGSFQIVTGVVAGFATENGVQIVPATGGCTGNPAVYCTSKVNSQGCTPSIGATGTPSASAGSGFVLTTTNELDNKFGLFFYSKTGANNAPFQGGFLCGMPPLVRTPVQNSGGTPPCGGAFTMDFNAYIAGGADPALISGQPVWVQTWSRDPASPSTTNLSDAITFTICP